MTRLPLPVAWVPKGGAVGLLLYLWLFCMKDFSLAIATAERGSWSTSRARSMRPGRKELGYEDNAEITKDSPYPEKWVTTVGVLY